jgi:error-prone DNA polymerase
VMQVAMTVGRFSAGQAEMLRRSMSRKRSVEAMEAHWELFCKGAAERGVPEETAKVIFKKLLGFASYGFPRSHAVAFARLAYESAWLRLHHPVEYYCALFNNQPMGFYPPGVLTGDAKRHGIHVLGPHVNRSGVRCTVEDDSTMRLGFSSISGMGEAAAEAIVAERQRAPFRSLFEFVQRTGLPRPLVEKLIMIGAFGELGLERRELLWQLGLFAGISGAHRSAEDGGKERGRQSALPLPVEADMVPLRSMSAWERLAADYDVLEFSPALHPLGLLRRRLGEGVATSRHVERLPHEAPVRIAGLVVCRQRPMTAKGILFVLLEDEFGLTNVVVHPGLYERQRLMVRTEPFVLVTGRIQRRGPTFSVMAESFARLPIPRDVLPPDPHDWH